MTAGTPASPPESRRPLLSGVEQKGPRTGASSARRVAKALEVYTGGRWSTCPEGMKGEVGLRP